MNTETIIEIKKLITEGKNVNYIAKKLNFSKSNIYKLIKKNGLSFLLKNKIKFLIKFPTRGRPEKFKDTFNNYINFLSKKHIYKFVCSFDEDDDKMNTDDIKFFLESKKNKNIIIEYHYGVSGCKIEAVNRDMENQDFDILILASDDMIPIIQNYDEVILNNFKNTNYGIDGVLHFNSSRWCDILDIMCIMGKPYYDRFNYIYNTNYKSIYCDNEYTEVSRLLNRHTFVEIEPFSHRFIMGDETERRNWVFNSQDESTYNNRKLINFEINKKDIYE